MPDLIPPIRAAVRPGTKGVLTLIVLFDSLPSNDETLEIVETARTYGEIVQADLAIHDPGIYDVTERQWQVLGPTNVGRLKGA